MGNLSAFLHPAMPEDKEVIVSDRFMDDGKVVPFRIRAISQEEVDAITKRCTSVSKGKNGREVKSFDTERFSKEIIVAGTAEPDFRNSELCSAYGTLDPLQVPGKMLLAGEYAKLGDAIAELSGLNDTPEEEAKNS